MKHNIQFLFDADLQHRGDGMGIGVGDPLMDVVDILSKGARDWVSRGMVEEMNDENEFCQIHQGDNQSLSINV